MVGVPDTKTTVADTATGTGMATSHLLEHDGVDCSKTAVVCGDRARTYGELRDAARRVAAGLAGLGIEGTDRVAVLSGNRLELIEIEIGIAGAGAVMVALDWRLRPSELGEQLRRTGARAILVEERLVGAILELRSTGALGDLRTVVTLEAGPADLSYEELFASSRAELPLTRRARAHPHKIFFRPRDGRSCRAVVWTEGAVIGNSERQAIVHRLGPDHSTYAVIDICDIGGRHDMTWAALRHGGTVHVASSRSIESREVFAYVAEHGITHLAWAPEPPRDVAVLPVPGEHDVSGLDTILFEGRSLPAAAVAGAAQAFPHIDLVQVYGLDDGGPPVASLHSEQLRRKPGSAGLPIDEVEVRIVGPDGAPADPSARGEVQVRGPWVSTLSWEDGRLAGDDLGDGWVATGDHGSVDEDGFLFLTERDGNGAGVRERLDWRIG